MIHVFRGDGAGPRGGQGPHLWPRAQGALRQVQDHEEQEGGPRWAVFWLPLHCGYWFRWHKKKDNFSGEKWHYETFRDGFFCVYILLILIREVMSPNIVHCVEGGMDRNCKYCWNGPQTFVWKVNNLLAKLWFASPKSGKMFHKTFDLKVMVLINDVIHHPVQLLKVGHLDKLAILYKLYHNQNI